MGTGLSRPECNIPVRSLIGVDNASAILMQCSRLKVMWMLGFLGLIAIVCIIGYAVTRNYPSNKFKVPAWLFLLPVSVFMLYTLSIKTAMDQTLYNESIEFQLSGMSKKDFLVHKSGDDRAAKSFAASATSAGLLTGSNILGPFLRGDR